MDKFRELLTESAENIEIDISKYQKVIGKKPMGVKDWQFEVKPGDLFKGQIFSIETSYPKAVKYAKEKAKSFGASKIYLTGWDNV